MAARQCGGCSPGKHLPIGNVQEGFRPNYYQSSVSRQVELKSTYLGPVTVDVLEHNGDAQSYAMECVVNIGPQKLTCKVIDAQQHNLDTNRNQYKLQQLRYLSPANVYKGRNEAAYFLVLAFRLAIAEMDRDEAEQTQVRQYFDKVKASRPSPEQMGELLHSQAHVNLIQAYIDNNTFNGSRAKFLEGYHQALKHNVAVDALFNMVQYLHFLYETFGRVGGATPDSLLLTVVNVPDLDNAFMTGEYFLAGNGSQAFYPLVNPDVVFHEVSHGIVQNTAGLKYEGHSGALNEAFSDIFGTGCEWFIYNKFNKNESKDDDLLGKFDYEIGEDAGKSMPFLRHIGDPTLASVPQPKVYRGEFWGDPKSTQDYGFVHINSGVWNHCFFLVQQKVGMLPALKLFWEVLTNMHEDSDYIDGRDLLKDACDNDPRVLACLVEVGLDDAAVSDQRRGSKRPRQRRDERDERDEPEEFICPDPSKHFVSPRPPPRPPRPQQQPFPRRRRSPRLMEQIPGDSEE